MSSADFVYHNAKLDGKTEPVLMYFMVSVCKEGANHTFVAAELEF